MAYQIYKFDDAILPLNNSDQTHTPGETDSSLMASVGGMFDYEGTYQRYPRSVSIDLSGWFVGQQAYEVDHSGNNIVDHSGNYIVTHTGAVDLRVQVEALQRKIGKRASLWRRWTIDNDTEQWKTARLLHIPYPQDVEDGCTVAEMSALFETRHAGWHAETESSDTSAVNSDTVPLNVYNGGAMRVDDATIEIEADGSDITSVQLEYAAAGIDLRYTGTIVDGTTLTIDCDAGTVEVGATDSYSGFALGSGHTARGWLPLEVGYTPLVVTTTGQGDVYIKHYNQWP